MFSLTLHRHYESTDDDQMRSFQDITYAKREIGSFILVNDSPNALYNPVRTFEIDQYA